MQPRGATGPRAVSPINGDPRRSPATIRREPRQARKGAAAAVDSGAGNPLAGVASRLARAIIKRLPPLRPAPSPMSYEVLARKWRPRTFSALVGQDHVVRALTNALDQDRVHHAFLFTGTRGVGKTTIARIFAKALNCERGVRSEPCGECPACVAIDEGRYVDLIEVDAASRTKVEDTRDLLENVQYAPTLARYKIYLIDEVHMLSTHSFNALLKTLEEPPPHVKFLLATTDPQKLPVTVLSRCLQFNLKRLPAPWIADHLASVLERETIAAEPGALQAIARAADGSMRDALSLLDQAIAFGGGALRGEDVADMLGTIDAAHITALLQALAAHDGGALLQAVAALSEQAPDYNAVLADLITRLQRIAVVQLVPDAAPDDWEDRETIEALAQAFAPEETQLHYQIALNGRKDLPLSPDPRAGFEMALLRMLAFKPAGASAPNPPPTEKRSRNTDPAANARQALNAAPSPKTPEKAPQQPPENLRRETPREHAPSLPPAQPQSSQQPDPGEDWHALVQRLNLSGMARELAHNAHLVRREGAAITLAVRPEHADHLIAGGETRLTEALGRHFGEPVRIRFQPGEIQGETVAQRYGRVQSERKTAARSSFETDPNVRAMTQTLDAVILPETIQPRDGASHPPGAPHP